MWIKICGLTTPAAVSAALAAGVDALGFVFAESTRRLTPEYAAQLARPARGRVRCIAVTRHPLQREIDQMLEVFAPDVLQGDLGELAALRLPAALERLPVLRALNDAPAVPPARILFESAVSGAGITADWEAAGVLARRSELVLAGGLTSSNVGAAIGAVRPFGVDVSTGVEVRPGVKSPAAIAQFVQAARAAAGALVN
ncbi:MAG TPA: phosphoribosylanthranilate isomerase [Steroidobacteraceae bacterium]|jgi:phosphoribosylanthranilate isomerase